MITTTSSSLPEVAGEAARLVDPDDPRSLAAAITEVAADDGLAAEMGRRGQNAASRFGVDQLGCATLDSYRKALASAAGVRRDDRPRLAVWTPVPPQQSGIADYSAELVEELSASCDLELFVEGGFSPDLRLVQRFPVHHFSAFSRRNRANPFDVTIYQMGNSHFHLYMHDAIRLHPGVLVLHDMAWGQVLYLEHRRREDLSGFLAELAAGEGHDAAREFVELDRLTPSVRERARLEFLDRYPMLGGLVDRSLAQIVHFEACRDELMARYPNARPHVVEMGVADPYGNRPDFEVGAARASLRLPPDSFVIGIFGIVHPVKRIDVCLRAVGRLLPSRRNLVLLVVGRMAGSEYEHHLRQLASDLGVGPQVRFTGHVSKDALQGHLIACDVVVNLRTPTHRHMSAILARAAAAAKPIVISDHEGWDFLAEPCFVRIPVDDREVDALAGALERLAADPGLRERLSASARVRFVQRGSSRQMAASYLKVVDSVRNRPGRERRAPAPAGSRAEG